MATHGTPRRTAARAWMKSQAAALVVIMIGTLILTIPPVLMGLNIHGNTNTTKSHTDASLALEKKERERIISRAREYNQRLARDGQPVMGEGIDPWNGTDQSVSKQDKDYNTQLAEPRDGVIASVSYPKLGINLPVRHGTGKHTLDSGAGHMYGTSLPVGGTDSHTVVTGHRGLVKSLMFTRLDELHDGDFMYIKVMDETLGYEVDRISVIEPDDVSRLKIVPGEDRLTLMTCTPYGINTHRLLVSGHRVAIPLPAPDPADVRDERATELGALAMTIVCTMGGMLLCCMVVRSMRPRHRIMRHASTWPRKG